MTRTIQAKTAAAALCVLWVTACQRETGLTALPAQELAGTAAKTFAQAPGDVSQIATQAVQSLQEKDYAKSLMAFKALSARPDLTPEQRQVASRCILTLMQDLQSAAARGDAAANDVLNAYRATK